LSPATGPLSGGTVVTIKGQNLTGATKVTFGAVVATGVSVVTATSLQATAPAHGVGVVDVRVVTPGGTSPVATGDEFSYQPLVTGVSPSSGPTKGGTTVTLTGSGLTGTTKVYFGLAAGSEVTVVNDNTVTVTSPTLSTPVATPVLVVANGVLSALVGAPVFTFQTTPGVTSVSPASGPAGGGTVVTVSGHDFSGATSVTFGSVSATAVTVSSAKSLQATAPAQAVGTVDVRVVTPAGTSPATKADQFAYLPFVTQVSPADGPLSDGSVVTVSGSGFSGATAVVFGTVVAKTFTVVGDGTLTVTPPAVRGPGTVDVRVIIGFAISAVTPADLYTFAGGLGGPSTIVGVAASRASGYWTAGSDGSVLATSGAGFYGAANGLKLNQPLVGIASSATGKGYWLVAADGGLFAYGDAGFFGSTGSIRLNKPIVGMAATPTGGGYWLVATDGGTFAFGDAVFYGSTGAVHLNQPIVGMAATPSGHGYRLVASDGGIFDFGDAGFFGSTGAIRLNRPIVGMATTPSGNGYWLVASDGGMFNFGDAVFLGSAGNTPLSQAVVGMAATKDGKGYVLVAADGRTIRFGNA
jgi:hypothetical protein